jgi:hypothetical protein
MELIKAFDVNIYWDDQGQKIEFVLLQDYSFEVEGLTINIQKGYRTDFATVPRFLWSVLPPIGRHNPAALVHDFLYDYQIGTRKNADKIFLKLMLQYQVPPVAAYVMYWGVRLGGRKWWKNEPFPTS